MINKEDCVELVDVKTDDITDYKKTSLYLIFPYCSGKCGDACQNKHLIGKELELINTTAKSLAAFYNSLHTHEAVVMAGLEPFDSFDDVLKIIEEFCKIKKSVDFVIYTGYTESEYKNMFEEKLLDCFSKFNNLNDYNKSLIVKVGRYVEDCKKDWESKILGVKLATTNQEVFAYIPNKDVNFIGDYKILKESYNND